jgi:hypothetical protein
VIIQPSAPQDRRRSVNRLPEAQLAVRWLDSDLQGELRAADCVGRHLLLLALALADCSEVWDAAHSVLITHLLSFSLSPLLSQAFKRLISLILSSLLIRGR